MKIAYEKGAAAAFNSFGLKVPSQAGMPEGPEHLGAEWLSKRLRSDDETYGTPKDSPSYRPLERPVRWGPQTSLESADSRASSPGVGTYGGV